MQREARSISWFTLALFLSGGILGAVAAQFLFLPQDTVGAAPLMQANNTPIPPYHIVISEIRTRGSNNEYDEFIELFNPTGEEIDITGWVIRQSGGCGGTVADLAVISSTTILSPGQHFLLANSNGYNGPVIPDLAFTAGVEDNGGIAIFNASGQRIDAIGLCPDLLITPTPTPPAQAFFEGTPLTPLTTNEDRGYERKPGGAGGSCYDTDDNAVDFTLISPSDPQNSSSQLTVCTGAATATATPTITPTFTATPTSIQPLAVLINEVAWAGTSASADDEWIELYNPSTQAINLSGWRLVADDGTPNIALSGQIAAGGYYVLERTDDTTISDITANLIYSGALSNNGEILHLLAPNDSVVDTANLGGGAWPAGSASPNYGSMERRGVMADNEAAWITNSGEVANGHDANGNPIKGTPGQLNWAYTVTPTPVLTSTLTPTRTLTLTRTPTRTRTPTPTRTSTRTLTPMPGVLVINEFLPRPRSDWNGDGVVNFEDEFIEVINVGTQAMDLKGWKLDDQANSGSSPYNLPDLSLLPGQIAVFYGSQTHISLSDGGDTVRLLRPGGQTADITNYLIVEEADQSWCRLPDGRGAWNPACRPTPGRPNVRAGSGTPTPIPRPGGGGELRICLLPDTLPYEILKAECESSGAEVWNSGYWDDEAERQIWLEGRYKWDVFIE